MATYKHRNIHIQKLELFVRILCRLLLLRAAVLLKIAYVLGVIRVLWLSADRLLFVQVVERTECGVIRSVYVADPSIDYVFELISLPLLLLVFDEGRTGHEVRVVDQVFLVADFLQPIDAAFRNLTA